MVAAVRISALGRAPAQGGPSPGSRALSCVSAFHAAASDNCITRAPKTLARWPYQQALIRGETEVSRTTGRSSNSRSGAIRFDGKFMLRLRRTSCAAPSRVELQHGARPGIGTECETASFGISARDEPRNHDKHPVIAGLSREGDDASRHAGPSTSSGSIAAVREQMRRALAQGEGAPDQRLLDAAVAPMASEIVQRRISPSSRARKVDRPAIVGIDQAEVPELGALIEVGHAGRGELAAGSAPGR